MKPRLLRTELHENSITLNAFVLSTLSQKLESGEHTGSFC